MAGDEERESYEAGGMLGTTRSDACDACDAAQALLDCRKDALRACATKASVFALPRQGDVPGTCADRGRSSEMQVRGVRSR